MSNHLVLNPADLANNEPEVFTFKIMTNAGAVSYVVAANWEEAYDRFNPSGCEGNYGNCVYSYHIVSDEEVEGDVIF